VKRLLIATVVLLLLAAGSGWIWAGGSLPLLDGQLALPGLHAPVEVLIDGHGVPAVYARDADDAWFAAGVFHARDRLWQMELYRRVTRGRLSEIMGARTVPIDERFLTLGLREAAEAEWQRASPAVKLALERYAAGVNAVQMQLVGRKRPLEFQLLGLKPSEWTPVDSLAVGRLLAWRLAENHQAELVRGALTAKIGETAARELTGRYPANGPAILGGPGSSQEGARPATLTRPDLSRRSALSAKAEGPSPTSRAAASLTEARRAEASDWPSGLEWLNPAAKRGNSNSWVIAGQKTRSGRPILANDPHLQIEFPSVWYEMHLVASGLDVAGVTIPGVPFVVLGHNARIAWGITNTNADVQDLFLERIDVVRKRSMWRGGWVPVEVTPVEIPVRGRGPRVFEIWKTRHGPIFAAAGLDWTAPPAWLSPEGRPSDEQRAYALRWDAGGDLAGSFEAIDRASDWASFVAAVESFSVPSSNFVYADVEGNIGYAMSGRVPIRSGGDGSMPIDGGSGAGEWTGTIDPATLPRVLNPASGFLVSANSEIDRGFGGLITRDWAAPWRAARLVDRIAKTEGVDLDATEALQNDRHSLAAESLLSGLEPAIAKVKGNDKEEIARVVLEKLANWDRVVDARPVVALYEAFEHAMWRRTFADELGDELFLKFYEWAGAERFAGLYAVMGDRQSKWFDDLTTVEKVETVEDIYVLAARDAEDLLLDQWGGESRRAWDKVHAARFEHALGGVAFPFAWFFNRGPVPITGDGTTVMRVSWNRLHPFQAWEYPSWRQIVDPGNWDQSRVAHPAGQSGNPMSKNYFDRNDGWRQGQYQRQAFTRLAVSNAAEHRLLLVP
jgi:penicillin amidase